MKKRSFLMAAFAAMFMASCSDNDLNQVDDSFIVDGNYKAYFKVAISNPPSTNSRALNDKNAEDGEFANGTGKESEIEKILFVFYNKSRNFVAQKMMDAEALTPTSGSVEATVEIVIPADKITGAADPYYVMAYVNPKENNSTDNLEEVANITRESYLNQEGYFIMNNSTYYEATGSTAPSCATVIGDEIYNTPEAANAADPLEIYVERLAAKVNVKVDEKAKISEGQEGLVNGYTLTFKPIAWGLNGTAKESFLVKQFRIKDGNDKLEDKKTYSEVNASLNKAFQDDNGAKNYWNYAGLFRSYWCLSNYYASGKYPSTTYDVTNPNNTYSLEYNSYNKITGDNTDETGLNTAPQYCMEHTINAQTLQSAQSKAAITSVVVVGEYVLKNSTTNETYEEGTTFYRYGKTNNVWDIYLEEDMMKKFAGIQMSVYKKTDDKYDMLNAESSLDDLKAIFTIEHPDKTVSGGVNLPERYFTLQVKDKVPGYYIKTDTGYEQITSENVSDVNKALYQLNMIAEKYNGGKVYFNIPIAHFGNTTNDEEIGVGYYGVVRNHAYNITITGISGMGTGIGDPTHPIVPPTEEITFHVKTQINVLAWRLASQEVELGK